MAIINKGAILHEGDPQRAIAELKGKIWRKVIDKHMLPMAEEAYRVISTKLLSGRTLVHVYANEQPGQGFENTESSLEDVYFATMAGHYGGRRTEDAV